MRIALIYALTEGCELVQVRHLEAGKAWVDHSLSTVQAVLGGVVMGEVEAKILKSLRGHPGMPGNLTELHKAVSRHHTKEEMAGAVKSLQEAGLVHTWTGDTTGGRPPTMVIATSVERPE